MTLEPLCADRPWNRTRDALFWIDPDPDCKYCGGHGADFVCFDPYPMSVPCQCTCRAFRLIARTIPCAEMEGAD